VIAALLLAATAASMQAGQAGQTGAPRSALWADASRLIAEYSGDGLLSKDEFAAFYADWRFESFRSGGDGALAEQRLSPDEFDAALLFLPVSGDAFAVASTAEWNARVSEAGGLSNAIHDYGDWLRHEHVQSIVAAPPLSQPRVGVVPTPLIPGMVSLAPEDPRQIAPALGEHGTEILRERGYDDAAIGKLVTDGALLVDGLG